MLIVGPKCAISVVTNIKNNTVSRRLTCTQESPMFHAPITVDFVLRFH